MVSIHLHHGLTFTLSYSELFEILELGGLGGLRGICGVVVVNQAIPTTQSR